MAQPTGSSYSALILPKPSKAPAKLPKAPAGKSPVAEAVKAVSSPKGLVEARANALFAAKPHPVAEATKQLSSPKGLPKAPKAKSGSTLATIFNLPAKIETKGYANLATATGIKPLNALGNIAAEAVNIPTQVLPSAYHAGKALGAAKAGHPQELHDLVKAFAQESAVAHLVKGDFSGALKAAASHPLNTALEAGGVASAVDRGLGALGRMSGVDAAKLADPGATVVSRSPRKFPTEDVPPGGVTVAQRPYSKGLVRPALEKKVSATEIPTGRVSPALRKSFDRFEGEHLRVTRATRDSILNHRAKAVKGVPDQGAITPFGQWLANPKALDDVGKPLYKKQLGEMVEHLEKAPPGEFKQEAQVREANVKHLKALQGKSLDKPYAAALQVAKDKAALEPELIKHGVYAPETIKIAKAIPAFRFHFRDQNPFVEPTVTPGESPFKLGGPDGKSIPVDEVYRQLRQTHGIDPKQLSFVSTRPFENGNAAFRSGRVPGGAKLAKGHLTGHAFMRGLFDPTYDAATRQHLTDAGVINKARGDLRFSKEYVHTRANVASLLEKRMDRLPPDQQAALKDYIQKDLRSGPGLHFDQQGGKSGWQHAIEAQDHLKALYPESRLEPIRVAHPYATKGYRESLGKHLDISAAQDMLDPNNLSPDNAHWQTRAPEESAAQNDVTAGPVGLVHQEIRDRVRAYEKDLGQAHLSRMPASFWRKMNVAFSVRHVPGVVQEIGGRMVANNIGPLSGMRATRAHAEIMRYAQDHPDPFVKLGAQRYDAMSGGTVSSQALNEMRHVTPEQLTNSKFGKPADWWNKGEAHKITGAPLRAVRGAVKAMNRGTNGILNFERKVIEHPPQVAGQGKHLNNEFMRLHGKRLKVIGAVSDVEKAFLHGQLDPKAIDHAAAVGREYWGDWTRSSPEFKSAQRVSPFLQWYANSMRFVYHTMPLHHPIKSGLISAIEGATREQRLAEGQEYKGGFPLGSHLLPTDLEPSQQGSIPYGNGERMGQQYYTPQGAVSAGPLETGLGALLPYASGIYNVAQGVNPITKRPLEETIEGKKQPIKDANKLALLAALSVGESFVPPLRYAKSLQTESPGHVFRPFRTEKTRTEGPTKKATKINLGSSLGSGLGSKLGSSLK
jgi:hypothetical protein